MFIQNRCFNCDREGPQEINALHSIVVLICLKCRPKFMTCFEYNMKDPDMGQKAAILDVLTSIVEDGPL